MRYIFVGKIVLNFFWKPTRFHHSIGKNYLYFLFIKPNQKSTTNLLFYSFKKDINCWAIWQKSLLKMVCSSVCPIDWKTKLDLIWKSINFIWRRREITLEKSIRIFVQNCQWWVIIIHRERTVVNIVTIVNVVRCKVLRRILTELSCKFLLML